MAASKGRRTRRTQTRQNDVNGAQGADVAAPGTDTPPRADDPVGAVWNALAANPGASAATIAIAAGVSKTVARRELTALETAGRATRTKGGRDGGKPNPDTWAPAADPAAEDTVTADSVTEVNPADTPADVPDGATPDTAVNDKARDGVRDGAPDDASVEGESAPPEPGVDEATSAGQDSADGGSGGQDDSGEGMDPAAVAEARDALTAMREVITSALGALDGGDGAEAEAAVEIVYGASGKARRLVRVAARGRPRTASGRAKSAPGQLRAKVAAHLAAFPDKEFTPHEIGKAINHSAGAVANALDKLVLLGEAVCTSERPRRFTAATNTTTTNTATTTDESADGDAVATAS